MRLLWRFKLLSLVLFLFPVYSTAQSTAVSGTLVDSFGVVWTSATITATFVPAPGVPGPYNWQGGVLVNNPPAVSSNSSGVFSITLPDNSIIAPAFSQWNFSICPNASFQCVVFNTPVTGVSVSISALFTANSTPQNLVQTTPIARAYTQAEILAAPPLTAGSTYFNTTSKTMLYWDGSSFQAFGGNANATTVNGAAVPASALFLGSNSSRQLIVATTPILPSPAGGQKISQPSDTTLGVNSINSILYADQYCTTAGTYDNTCLTNAITAAGNNSKIVLSPHNYVFASEVIASSLSNVTIEGYGATVTMDGNAFICTSCISGGIYGVTFNSATVPQVIPCILNPPTSTMTCPTLPATGVVVLDPWSTGIGHIPSEDDASIISAAPFLSAAQSTEKFDTGVEYVSSSGVTVSNLKGTYYHIDIIDSSDILISGNSGIFGTGIVPEANGGNLRCGGICLWTQTPTAGQQHNHNIKITDNNIAYAQSRSIAVISSEGTYIAGNTMSYAGEGGVVMGEDNGSSVNGFYSIKSKIVGNIVHHSLFDGFDVSSCFPSCAGFNTYNTIVGNTSSYNFHTGYIGNGSFISFNGNYSDHNNGAGYVLDFANSIMDSNMAYDNVLGNFTNGQVSAQFMSGQGATTPQSSVFGNTITNNKAFVDTGTPPSTSINGFQIFNGNSTPSIVSNNFIVGNGLSFDLNFSCNSCGMIYAENNFGVINHSGSQVISPNAVSSVSGTPAFTAAFGSTPNSQQFFNFQLAPNLISAGRVGWDMIINSTAGGVVFPLRFNDIGQITNAISFLGGISIGGGAAISNSNSLPQVGTPTINQAACIKATGPPVVIGFCSTVVSGSGGCTCN